ncbi:unnamed protein product [Rotaria socialis]
MTVNKYSSGLPDTTVETFQPSILSTINIITTSTLTLNNKNNLLLLEKNISSNSSHLQGVDAVKRSTPTPEEPMTIKE